MKIGQLVVGHGVVVAGPSSNTIFNDGDVGNGEFQAQVVTSRGAVFNLRKKLALGRLPAGPRRVRDLRGGYGCGCSVPYIDPRGRDPSIYI